MNKEEYITNIKYKIISIPEYIEFGDKEVWEFGIIGDLPIKEEQHIKLTPFDNLENLQQENKQLNKQLEYLRSGEYYNQLRFERDMLQDLVDKCEVSKEDKTFIDCTHRNTELLEELEEEKRINEENLKIIDRQQEIIQELRADYGTQAQVERDLLQMRIDKALNLVNECEEDLLINSNWLKELLDVLKGE